MDAVDRDLAIRTVLAEAGGQGPLGMAAVANVIRNRAATGRYGGSTPAQVVTAENQFEPWNYAGTGKGNDPARFDPSSPSYQQAGNIVDAVFSGQQPDPTNGATHFYSPSGQTALGRKPPAWAGKGSNEVKIGGHVFSNPDGSLSDLTQVGMLDQTARGTPSPTGLTNSATTAPAIGATASPQAPGAGLPSSSDIYKQMLGLSQQPGAGAHQPGSGIIGQLLFGKGGIPGAINGVLPNGLLGGLLAQLKGGGGAAGAAPGAAPMQLSGATPPGVPQTEIPQDQSTPPMPPQRPDGLGGPQTAPAAAPGQTMLAGGPLGNGLGVADGAAADGAPGGLSGLSSLLALFA